MPQAMFEQTYILEMLSYISSQLESLLTPPVTAHVLVIKALQLA